MAESYSVKAVLSAVDSGFVSTFGKAQSATQSLMSSVKNTALGAMAFKGVSAAVNTLSSNVGSAVSRFDTLNQYPRVLKQMGFSADEAKDSIKELGDGIQYVPTSLDEIASSAKSLALTNGNLKKSTKLAVAMNNAFYASGSASDEASRGMTQFTQMLSRGKVGQEEWNTLNETMKYGLTQTAKKLGIASGSTTELYDALQDGTITMDQFTDAIIECSEETGGFAEVAKTSTAGISTSMSNLKISIVKGMAGALSAIDTFLAANQLPTISQMIDSVKDKIGPAFDTINSKIETFGSTKAFQTVSKYASMFFNTVKTVGPAVGAIFGTIGKAIWEIVSDAETMSTVKSALDGIGSAAESASKFITDHKDAVKKALQVILVATVAFKAFGTAMAIGGAIATVAGPLISMAKSVGGLGKSLSGAAKGTEEMAKKSGTSSKKLVASAKAFALMGVGILAVSAGFFLLAKGATAVADAGPLAVGVLAGLVVAVGAFAIGMTKAINSIKAGPAKLKAISTTFLAIGASVLIASTGLYILAQAAIQLANAGPGAVATMVLMVGALAGLATGASVLAPALTAGAAGLVAFGVAVLLVGAGALLAATALTLVAGVLPQIATYGTRGAVSIAALGASLIVFGAGAAVAGAGAIVLGAGLVVVGAGAVVAAAGIALMGAGVLVLGAGVLVLAAGLTACTAPLTMIGTSGMMAATALAAMAAASVLMAAGSVALIAGLAAAGVGIVAFAAAGVAASAGFLALSASLGGVKKKMASIADSTSTVSSSFGKMKSSLKAIPGAFKQIASAANATQSGYTASLTAMSAASSTAGQQMGSKLASSFSASSAMIVATARSMANNAGNAMRSGYSSAVAAGRYIGQGLAIGLLSSYGQVASAAARLAAAADKAIRAKAKIGSPSRVAIKTFSWIGKGAAIGLEKMQGKVAKASADLFNIPSLYEPDFAFAGGGMSASMNLNESLEYSRNINCTINVPLDINGRQFAKATATYTQDELNRLDKRNMRKRGEY